MANLRELGKASQGLRQDLRRCSAASTATWSEDPDFYRGRLDELCAIFGEDRVLYGSDWPNSDRWRLIPRSSELVRDYFHTKGRAAQEKYFWKNSVAAYRWVKRESAQPEPRKAV